MEDRISNLLSLKERLEKLTGDLDRFDAHTLFRAMAEHGQELSETRRNLERLVEFIRDHFDNDTAGGKTSPVITTRSTETLQ